MRVHCNSGKSVVFDCIRQYAFLESSPSCYPFVSPVECLIKSGLFYFQNVWQCCRWLISYLNEVEYVWKVFNCEFRENDVFPVSDLSLLLPICLSCYHQVPPVTIRSLLLPLVFLYFSSIKTTNILLKVITYADRAIRHVLKEFC